MSTDPSTPRAPAYRALTLASIVGLLYFGRLVFEPLAVAFVISLAMAPLVRRIKALGLGHAAAVLLFVGVTGLCMLVAALALGAQLASVASELPRYESRIHDKVGRLRAAAEQLWEPWRLQVNGIFDTTPLASTPNTSVDSTPLFDFSQSGIVSHLFGFVWGSAGEAVIAFVLLLFLLLEHESLGDRLIHLTQQANVARTVQAWEDASDGISRFFLSQFAINLVFAMTATVVLTLIGLPHALLWGALGGLLRFVPYVGVPLAVVVTGAFSVAVDPGWSLLPTILACFVVLEVVTAYVVEPKVYSHNTGLTPLSVLLAALVWGTLWGPVGLLLSTPLTLCLLVFSRHVREFAPLATLMGGGRHAVQALRFYRFALGQNIGPVLQEARGYLKKKHLETYFDDVLLPGLDLVREDHERGRISLAQQKHVLNSIISLADGLSGTPIDRFRLALGTSRASPLEPGALRDYLQQRRESSYHQSTGSKRSALCLGLSLSEYGLLDELLAILLVHAGVEAHSLHLGKNFDDLAQQLEPYRDSSTIYLTFPLEQEVSGWTKAVEAIRTVVPGARLIAVRYAMKLRYAPNEQVDGVVDRVVASFSAALKEEATPPEAHD